jgi:hypothetical protein
MLYTLADARTAVGRYVDAGSCKVATIDARINEALERLTDADELSCMQKFIRISVCGRCFPLPYNVEKILWASIDGTPANIYGLPYQFLSSGPGDLDYRGLGSCFRDLTIKSYDSPVMFDVPHEFTDEDGTEYEFTGLKLIAFSTHAADVTEGGATGAPMRVQGFDSNAREINAGTDPGVDVPIHRWKAGTIGRVTGKWTEHLTTTAETFETVTRVVKGVTEGAITLYAVDTTNEFFFFLGEFHPGVEIPSFTRYNVTNKSIGERANILALVKLRHVTLTEATDILPIDSLQALKLMCIAITQENIRDFAGAKAYEADARRLMGDREKSRTNTGGMPVIMNRGYRTSLGRRMNHRLIL